MNSILGLSEPADPTPIDDSPAILAVGFPGKRLSAAVLSAIIPGAGQLLFGQVRSAALFLAGFAATFALFWPLRLPGSYVGFSICILAVLTFSIWAACHVACCSNEKHPKLRKWWLVVIIPIAFLIASYSANLPMRAAGFRPFNIPSSSMENTLIVGDRIIVDLRYYAHHLVRTGDVVVFHHNNSWVIKRAIAVEGDTIYGRADLIYVNGTRLYETFVQHAGNIGNPYTSNFGPVTVPKGQIFVLGDNRDISYDSRQPDYGPVHFSDVAGKPLYITWSRHRRGVGASVR
jgi:signal peptidase I